MCANFGFKSGTNAVSRMAASRYGGGMQQERQPPPQDDTEDEHDRRVSNVVLLVFFAAVVGAGIWLVNAMIDHRKLDDCVAQGRRNCAPIDVPAR
jgi:hypothetical protein